jgi:secondary thiamine-phosphate synthase enzyme
MADFVQANHMLTVETAGKGFYEITGDVARWLSSLDADTGLLTVFVCHTSASLTIQENADPNVRLDLLIALDRFAPEDWPYAHQEEGPDDMPSHIKALLTSVSIGIPVNGGKMALGSWQGLYLIEHRAIAHRRNVALSFLGHQA